jgi:exosortase
MRPVTLAPEAARRSSIGVLTTVALGLLLAALYVSVVRDLLAVWRDVPYYSYGVLIPLFSAFLAWERRDRVRGTVVGWRPALLLVATGIGVLRVGSVSESLTVQVVSIPVTLAGLGLFALGRERFRPLAAPVAFLTFMTPLPPGVIPELSLPLQRLAAVFAASALHLLGIPATRNGLLIHLARVSIHVTEACNGLRFLLAMLVVGTAFAWLTQRTTRARVAVIVLAAGAAVVANLLRVAGTAVAAEVWGPAAASGTVHVAFGKVVYGLMLVPFTAGVLWLRRVSSRRSTRAPGPQS